MKSEALRSIFSQLGELDRIELLRDCGIRDRPPSLRGRYDTRAHAWVDRNANKLVDYIFRYVDPTDDAVAELSEARLIHINKELFSQSTFKVIFTLPSKPAGTFPTIGKIPLNEIAGTGLALTELMIALGAANRPLGIEPVMPNATVESGSVHFALEGPALAAAGLGLLVAAATGVALPVALPVAVAAGAAALTLGSAASILDLATKWEEWRIAQIERETQLAEFSRSRAEAETVKIEQETKLAEWRRRVAEAETAESNER